MPHPCGYLPDRIASTLFIDPRHPIGPRLFAALMRQGFRRSGDLIYRPHCTNCASCVGVRVAANRFRPTRGQRRTWKKNQDLQVLNCDPVFRPEHFALYRRYQAKRHPGGNMDSPDPKKYMDFLVGQHAHTRFFEFREPAPGIDDTPSAPRPVPGRLLGVAVADLLPDGLSAVYTFYEPDCFARALGVYALLWEIRLAKQLELPWLYLGYWIGESRKMAYKAHYRPLEAYHNGRWTVFNPDGKTGENDT